MNSSTQSLSFWQSITTKLVVVFLLFGLIPLAVVSVMVWDTGNKFDEKVGKQFELVAETISNKIDRTLFERYGDVQVFSLNANILRRIHWYDRSEDNLIPHLMNQLSQQYGIYDLMIMVDLEGKVIAVNSQDPKGNEISTQYIYEQNYAKSTWFRRLQQKDYTTTQPYAAPGNERVTGTVIEDLHVDEDVIQAYPGSDGLTLGFSAPVYEDGQVVAYWTNRTSFSIVEDIAVQAYQGLKSDAFPGSEITLLNGDGVVLMDYDPMRHQTSTTVHDLQSVILKLNLVQAGVEIAKEAVAGKTGYLEAMHARKQILQKGGFTHLRGYQGYPGMNWSVLVRVPSTEAAAERNAIFFRLWLAAFLIFGILFPIALFVGKRATARIKHLESTAQDMSKGNFTSRAKVTQKDELGRLATGLNELGENNEIVIAQAHAIAEGNFALDVKSRGEQDSLGKALQGMIESLREVSDMAGRVSEGDFSQRITPKGEHDLLGQSMNSMVAHFQELAIQVDTVAEGNYAVEVVPRSQEDILGHAFSRMVAQIRERTEVNQRETWLKSGITQLAECTQGDPNIQIISSRFLSNLVKLVQAGNGAVYVKEQVEQTYDQAGDISFQLMGTYAYQTRKSLSTRIHMCEGLVGQCAFEKEAILLTQVPLDYVPIQSGLGEKVPNQVLVTPVLFEGDIVGVIELASFHDMTDLQRELVTKAADNFGITLNSLFSRQETEQLLEKSQSLTLELQAQQEELRTTNEELQLKAQELQQSEDELRQQSDELRVSNDELQNKSDSLKIQNAEIERKNQSIEIAQLDLEKKAQDLAQASKYKSEFLANMSHELRTPLNSLLILAKTLTDNDEGNLTEDQIESARVIHSGGKDLLHLINDILDLSKVEAGKLSVNVESVSLDDVCERLHSLAAPLAKEKGNVWSVERENNIPSVLRTDQQRLEQILKNLVSNACKFTSQGSVTLRLHRIAEGTKFHHATLLPQSTIVFSVVDTGMGIPEEKQAAIFEAFQQADGSTSRTYGGTGLGLTISRELAGMLGGEIQLVSEAGKGSTFSLYLPCDYTESIATLAPSLSSQEKITKTNVQGMQLQTAANPSIVRHEQHDEGSHSVKTDPNCLVIIEDDPVFGKILRQYAEKQGYVCSWAQTGQEGLQLASTMGPAAILLDMTLPDLTGDEVLVALKQNATTSEIPVHVISGRDDLRAMLTKGAVGYLTKPVDGEVLRETIKNISQNQGKSLPNVLLVEDDPIIQQATCQMIQQQGGAEVTVVGTAQDALDYLRTEPCDLLITDLRLPDRSGLELLRAISDEQENTLPPVIVYTGKDLSREEHQELLEYAACVVMKGGLAPERLLEELSGIFQAVPSPETVPLNTSESPSNDHRVEDTSFLEGQTLLVVDDDLRNVFALSKILKKAGANVVIADTGTLALEKLETEETLNAILLDIMMPEMDGYETTRRIREHPRYAEVPIVMLSAKTMPDEEAKCLEVGANGYVSKPVDLQQLYRVMAEYLARPLEKLT